MLCDDIEVARPKITSLALRLVLEELERCEQVSVDAGEQLLTIDLDELRALVADAEDLGTDRPRHRYRLD